MWIDHCNKEKARSLTASWQSNALKLGIPLTEGGQEKSVTVLKQECRHAKESKDRQERERDKIWPR